MGKKCASDKRGPKIFGLLDELLSLRPRNGIESPLGLSKGKKDRISHMLKELPIGGVDLDYNRLWKAVAFSRAYLEVLYDHIPSFCNLDWDTQVSIIQVSYGWKNFEKIAKYYTCAPIARYLNNDLPPAPESGLRLIPFTGKALKFLKNLLISKSKRNLHLWNSILQGVKRGCLPPDKTMVEKQLLSHGDGLSRAASPLNIDYRQKFREALRNLKFRRSGFMKDTGGASYLTPRSLGGKWEEVIRKFNNVSFDEVLIESELYWMDDSRVLYMRNLPTWHDVRAMVTNETDVVKAVGLLEALKVRVITTGDATKSVYLEHPRKIIHDLLRKMGPFRKLDQPRVESRDLEEMLEKEAKLGINFPSWVSGDYSAATDNLNMNATRQAVEVILEKLGLTSDIEYFTSSLCGTQLAYPPTIFEGTNKEFTLHGDSALRPQRNGQLMGNPMSFPILCLVNLVGYWTSLEEYLHREIDIEDLPVMINGDDILFRADSRFLELWQDSIRSIGFTLSIGKYYVHECVATLNSQMFLSTSSGFTEITYTNVGLLSKSGFAGDKRSVLFKPIDALFSEHLRGAFNKDRAKARMLHYWQKTVNKATDNGRLNLFLPRSAGGLGAENHGARFHITKYQKQLSCLLSSLQKWNPGLAQKWTVTPLREDYNSHNSCEISTSPMRKIWTGEDVPLFLKRFSEKGLYYISNDDYVSLQKYQEHLTFWSESLSELRISPPSLPVLPLKPVDGEIATKRIICVPPGGHRVERTFRPNEDWMWYRMITTRARKWLLQNYPAVDYNQLPMPERRDCILLSGHLLPWEHRIARLHRLCPT